MKAGGVVFLVIVTFTAALAVHAPHAAPMPRLGMLLTGSPSTAVSSPASNAFMRQLAALGWIEGRTLAIERRWAERPERFPELAADLVRARVSVILAPGPSATTAARAATSTTPIVMVASTDPRVFGVASLAHPGGNLTGLTIGQPELVVGKRLELLKEAIPGLSRVAVLWDVPRPSEEQVLNALGPAAALLGVRLQHVDVNAPGGFERAFGAARAENADGVIMEGPRATANRGLVAGLALKQRLPMMSQFPGIAESGALMAYGPDLEDLFVRAAGHVDKILRGAKPGDLPIEQPTKFRLVVNMKTAKALRLTIPPSVLLRADQVVE